jgi:type I restriction enzyme, R subunit
MTANQNPEQQARDQIDAQLQQAGWVVQDNSAINLHAGLGQAVREYQTDAGPADYLLFVNGQAVGVIEAKREEEGYKITAVEEQTGGYAAAKLKWITSRRPLRFLFESTGVITRFTDAADPHPRSREIFNFPRPETLQEWLNQPQSLRARLHDLPPIDPTRLRHCQIVAINNLDASLKQDKPRALVQMATGAGKTFTAITAIYRLLKFAGAKRVLFLVDTKNLGEQAEQEMMAYTPGDDNRKFTELYNVQRLKSAYVARDSQVCISTIQRLYAILKGQELDEAAEELNPNEMAAQLVQPKEPMPVVYNEKVPPEFFDFIIIDECHRSIYNLWRQVLDYFDAYLIGLTATPDNRTYGFFRKNVVSDYDHEKAVADGVNVGNEVYLIDTRVTRQGGQLRAEQLVEKREKLSRRRRWEQQDEDEAYSGRQLDKDMVNPDQIRTVIRAFRDSLPAIFPGRSEAPKTLIFAKTDSHADDIIQTVREEFGEGNAFCKKVTYKSDEDPKSVLAQFRNEYNPRIAVTVDMIATGTDVKPLECLLFMRDVKSRNYFEQMKGRGTRTLEHDDLKKVTPSARSGKTHYVIVDAIGVTKSLKTASQPLISKPTVPLKDLLMGLMMGASDDETVRSLAGRLARLNRQIGDEEREQIEAAAGLPLTKLVGDLLHAVDPDVVEAQALALANIPPGNDPGEANRQAAQEMLVQAAARPLTGQLVALLDSIRRAHEQTIDHETLDAVDFAGWGDEAAVNAQRIADEMAAFFRVHQDELEALTIFFSQPYRRHEATNAMIHEVLAVLKREKPALAPARVWAAYAQLDNYKGSRPLHELTLLVGLIRRVSGLDERLADYGDTVRRNFQTWVMGRHAGAGEKFNEAQMAWLHLIRDHMITSYRLERDDLEMAPFDAQGGLGRMYQLFGGQMDDVMAELNEALSR